MILLMSGFPDAAIEMLGEASELAQRLAHPFSMWRALYMSISVRFQLEDFPGMQTAIQKLVSLCEEHDLNPLFLSLANIFRGHALIQSGEHDEGEARIRSGMEDWERTGVKLLLQHRLFILADALKMAGKMEDGLTAVDEAFSYMRQSNARLYEPELHRLQGELLLLDGKAETEAEAAYRRSIDIAQRQDAKLFELRAAVGLAHLLRNQSRGKEALEMLAPIYGWLTEGFDTRDLKEAKALLDELS